MAWPVQATALHQDSHSLCCHPHCLVLVPTMPAALRHRVPHPDKGPSGSSMVQGLSCPSQVQQQATHLTSYLTLAFSLAVCHRLQLGSRLSMNSCSSRAVS